MKLFINDQMALFLRLCLNFVNLNCSEIVEKSEGKIPRGSVFVIAERLERNGFVLSIKENNNPFIERIFCVTDKGRLLLDFFDKLKSME